VAIDATQRARLFVLILVLVVFGGLAAFFRWRARQTEPNLLTAVPAPTASLSNAGSATAIATAPVPLDPTVSTPSPVYANPPANVPIEPGAIQPAVPANSFVGSLKLIVPVVGVKPEQLQDTFADARSEGRVHDAIDIPAPAGTAVLAAADGEIVKLFQSERGGTTIYQLSTDRKLIFYYAHLQRYADGLAAGKFARQGEVIAYVGDTGNAGAGNFHLHFSISIVADPKRYWEGTNINPYPLLRH
jgi:murein DD-endopeptidase MepM/ murein hydrolase activator NlpD